MDDVIDVRIERDPDGIFRIYVIEDGRRKLVKDCDHQTVDADAPEVEIVGAQARYCNRSPDKICHGGCTPGWPCNLSPLAYGPKVEIVDPPASSATLCECGHRVQVDILHVEVRLVPAGVVLNRGGGGR